MDEINWIGRILDPDNLRLAWEEVAENKGSPGIDRISLTRWSYNWEERLVKLACMVRTNTYKPRKSRKVYIPKKDGSFRTISILTVTDRVLQRACLRVVDDYFDHIFLECSHGYRLGRGVRSAIPQIINFRDAGLLWVLDADIDDCFGSLDHDLIIKLFSTSIDDYTLNRLFSLWLAAGKSSPDDRKGILLGAVISPLLCNIYLHQLDKQLSEAGFNLVRYADDFCVFCVSEEDASIALSLTNQVLKGLKLRLEPHKTNITHFEHGFDFLGVRFYRDGYSFTCNQKKIEVQGEFDPSWFYQYVPDGYEG